MDVIVAGPFHLDESHRSFSSGSGEGQRPPMDLSVADKLDLDPGSFALVGMGCLLGGILHAPLGSLVMFSMLPLSGLFPIALPPSIEVVSRFVPLTYAVSLLSGIWQGDPWSAHLGNIAALVVVFAVCTLIASRVFRWD